MYRSIPKPPMPPSPGQTPGHLTFLINFGQIPRDVANLDGQMPHPLEIQRGSNPPPSRHVKATVETSSAKFSATTNFLFSLSSLHTLNKGIFRDITISNDNNRKTYVESTRAIWPVNAAQVLNQRIGHFRVPWCLCFKASLSTKSFLWKWLRFAWEINCLQNTFSYGRFCT